MTIAQGTSSKRKRRSKHDCSLRAILGYWDVEGKDLGRKKNLTEPAAVIQGHIHREAEGKDGISTASSFTNSDYRLQNLNVLSLPTLRAFGYVELNRLAFLKSAEAVRLYRCVVHENILTICTAQKAEPLGIVEPFHCTLFHCVSSLVTR